MKQVDMKSALMQNVEFKKAYMNLKEMLNDEEYWFIDSLNYFNDTVSVIIHPEYKARYGDFWLMFAETSEDENMYGFLIVEEQNEE